ncbi:MAG: hypothetical protein HOP31_09005 [Ignavibacteria bacterium]|nr:hypothetical protein [Ignavibacteria bacterium]
MGRTATLSVRVNGLSNIEIERVRAIAAIKTAELRREVDKILERPILSATELIEHTNKFALVSSDIRFKANDGKEYYFEVKPHNQTNGSIYNSLAWNVFCELYPDCIQDDDTLYNLTNEDYLKYLNIDSIKKQWVEDVE